MRIEIKILNNTTGERIYAISEGDIDSAIAHLGTFERHMQKCLYCKEPLNSANDGYCIDACREGKHFEQLEDQENLLHNPF